MPYFLKVYDPLSDQWNHRVIDISPHYDKLFIRTNVRIHKLKRSLCFQEVSLSPTLLDRVISNVSTYFFIFLGIRAKQVKVVIIIVVIIIILGFLFLLWRLKNNDNKKTYCKALNAKIPLILTKVTKSDCHNIYCE